jgi:hypothetical protein
MEEPNDASLVEETPSFLAQRNIWGSFARRGGLRMTSIQDDFDNEGPAQARAPVPPKAKTGGL